MKYITDVSHALVISIFYSLLHTWSVYCLHSIKYKNKKTSVIKYRLNNNLLLCKSGNADDLLPLQEDHDEGPNGLPEEGIHRCLLLKKLPV